MNDTGSLLPEEFADLEPYRKWSAPTEGQRIKLRDEASDDELRIFYGAVMPRMEAIAEYLGRFPLSDMPEDAARLFNIAKSAIEVSNTVEHGRSLTGWRFDIARFVPMHEKRGQTV